MLWRVARDPVLRNSVQLRNPYIDPLNYLQILLLRRLALGPALRAGESR